MTKVSKVEYEKGRHTGIRNAIYVRLFRKNSGGHEPVPDHCLHPILVKLETMVFPGNHGNRTVPVAAGCVFRIPERNDIIFFAVQDKDWTMEAVDSVFCVDHLGHPDIVAAQGQVFNCRYGIRDVIRIEPLA